MDDEAQVGVDHALLRPGISALDTLRQLDFLGSGQQRVAAAVVHEQGEGVGHSARERIEGEIELRELFYGRLLVFGLDGDVSRLELARSASVRPRRGRARPRPPPAPPCSPLLALRPRRRTRRGSVSTCCSAFSLLFRPGFQRVEHARAVARSARHGCPMRRGAHCRCMTGWQFEHT